MPEAWKQMSGRPWDGQQDWWIARFFWEGLDPYGPVGLKRINFVVGHPPTSGFYALPLALFELAWMGRLLGSVVIAMLYAGTAIVLHELRVRAAAAWALLATGILLHAPFVLYHLGVAQVSALIAFAIILAWYWLRRGRDVPAGIALGLACTIKLFPGGLVLLLVLTRRWRGVIAAAATWLGVCALMTARLGVGAWRHYFTGEKQLVDWWMGHASNTTLQGIVLRLFHPACVSDTWSDATATRIAIAASLLLLALIYFLSRRSRDFDLSFALFVVWSLLANAFYWEHYHVLLILPFAIVIARLTVEKWPWKLGGALLLTVAVRATLIPPNSARVLLTWARNQPELHMEAHLTEIATALPMPLLLLLLAFAARRKSQLNLAPSSIQTRST
jgi:alpha-1,2-mannosyltransferase